MTVQTEVRPGGIQVRRQPIRGFKGFVFGIAALMAAGAGIGIGVAVTGSDRPAVVAPDSPEVSSLKRMHAENYLNPGTTQQLEALQRHHEDAAASSYDDSAFKRFKEEAWSN